MEFLGVALFLLLAVGVAVLRGASRSTFRLIGVGISAVAAFAVTLFVKSSALSDKTLAQIASLAGENVQEMLAQIAQYSPSLEKLLVGSAVSMLAPMMFLVLFISFLIATWVLYFFITLILFPVFHGKEKRTSNRKLKALVIGAVQAVVVMFLVLSPISYYGNITMTALDSLEDSGMIADIAESAGMTEEELKKNLYTSTDSALIKVNSTLGGDAFCSLLSNYKFTDASGATVKVDFGEELVPILEMATNVVKLTSVPMDQFGEAEAQAIENIGTSFTKSPLVKAISCELVHGLTGAWKDGEAFATIAKPQVDAPIDGIFNNTVNIFYGSSENSENLGKDIQDISKIVAVMIKSDVMKEMSNPQVMLDKLSQTDAINDVTTILRQNERLRPLMSDITNLSIYFLADSIGVPKDNEAVYLNMLNDVAAKLNETKDMDPVERVETLKPFIKSELSGLGTEVSDEYIDSVCQALVNDFGDKEIEITPEFVAEFFLVYSEHRGDVDTGSSEIANNCNGGVVNLGGEDGRFTYPGYATEEARNSSGAAIIGKLDAEIIKISGKGNDTEEKREELNNVVNELMAPIFNSLIEKSENKEKAASVIENYTSGVVALSEKESDSNRKSSNNIASFAKAESANINCMTLEKIQEKFSVSGEITDEAEAEKHSEVIKEVVGCASSLLAATNKGDGEGAEGGVSSAEVVKAATAGLGKVFDTLADTNLYGNEGTAELMESILFSETVSNVLPLTKEEAGSIIDKVKNDEKVSYGSLMNGVSGMADLIISMTKGECTEDSVKNLIVGLDENNIEAIMIMVTEDRFSSMGIGEDKLPATKKIMTNLLEELAKISEENADKEAKAVKKLIDVALAAKNGGTGLFGDEGRIGDAGLFIEEVLASEAVCNTLTDIDADPFGVSVKISDTDKQLFAEACEAYLLTDNAETVRALASVLGIGLN